MTLTVHLGLLESAGLIQLASVQPELEYLFRHVLVKDAAYQSLVKGERRWLHRAVGEALEQRYGASSNPAENAAAAAMPGELYNLLAFHFAEAGDATRAQHYDTLAGQAAASAYANQEAAAHFTQAITAARHLGAPAADLIDLYTRLGRVQELSGHYNAALATYAQLEMLGEQRGNRTMLLAAILAQAVVRAVPSAGVDAIQADHLTGRALQLARELGDRATEARALWTRMLWAMLIGNSTEAVQAGEASLALARDLGLREQYATTLVDLGRAYAGGGLIEKSQAALEEARELWRSLGNQPMLAESLNDAAATFYFQGEHERALALLDEAQALSLATGNAWGQAYSLMLRSYVLLERGALQDALDAMYVCLELAGEGGFFAPQVETRSSLALLYAHLGQFERANAEIQSARAMLGDDSSPVMTALIAIDANVRLLAGDLELAENLLTQGKAQGSDDLTAFAPPFVALADAGLGLARGDYARAEEAARSMLELERKVGLHALSSDLQLALARALIGLERLDEAGAVLAAAQTDAEARGTRRIRWELLAAQAEVAVRRGDADLSGRLWREARDAVEALAADLADPELRASLLKRPNVQTVRTAAERTTTRAP